MAARANAFSASDKVRNNPKVQQAISDANETTARKQKSGEASHPLQAEVGRGVASITGEAKAREEDRTRRYTSQ
jgi:hypothetical protein